MEELDERHIDRIMSGGCFRCHSNAKIDGRCPFYSDDRGIFEICVNFTGAIDGNFFTYESGEYYIFSRSDAKKYKVPESVVNRLKTYAALKYVHK